MADSNIATLTIDIVAKDSKLKVTLRSVDGQLKQAESSAAKRGASIFDGWQKKAAAGALGIGAAAVNAAMQWESAFVGVTKTVDGTQSQLAALSDELRNLATSGSTGGLANAHTELANIAAMAGQLGVPVQNIGEFTSVIGELQIATNLLGDQGATQMARFMNIMGIAPDNVRSLADTVVHLGNNSATTEAEIVEFGMRLAAAGKLAGFSGDEVMAMAAAMSSLGINAEAGGTAMSQVWKKIVGATIKGGDELDSFAAIAKKTGAEFAALWKADPAQAFSDFIKGMGDLSEGQKLSFLEDMDLDAIRISDALLRMSGNADLVADSFDLLSDKQNALGTESERFAETTEAQWNRLKNTINDVGISLGDLVLPTLNAGLTSGGDLLSGIAQLFRGQAELSPEDIQQQIIDDVNAAMEGVYRSGQGPVITYTIEAGDDAATVAAALGVTLEEATRLMREQGGFVSVGVMPTLKGFAATIGATTEEASRILEAAGISINAPVEVTAEMILARQAETGEQNLDVIREQLEAEMAGGARVNMPAHVTPELILSFMAETGTTRAQAETILNQYFANQQFSSRVNTGITITIDDPSAIVMDPGAYNMLQDRQRELAEEAIANSKPVKADTADWIVGMFTVPTEAIGRELGFDFDPGYWVDMRREIGTTNTLLTAYTNIVNALPGPNSESSEIIAMFNNITNSVGDAVGALGGFLGIMENAEGGGNAGRDTLTTDFELAPFSLEDIQASLDAMEEVPTIYFTVAPDPNQEGTLGSLLDEEDGEPRMMTVMADILSTVSSAQALIDGTIMQRWAAIDAAIKAGRGDDLIAGDVSRNMTIDVTYNVIGGIPPGAGGVGLDTRAEGGPVRAGEPYVVGEKGPELFMPGQSGYIVPNPSSSGASMSGGSSVTVQVMGDVYDSRSLDNLVTRVQQTMDRRRT